MPSSKQGQSSITLRCTQQEHEEIEKKANQYGMTISEYVRFVTLNCKIEVRADK
jgi:predicted DNA binding CopG/RHH family protein